MLESIGAPLFYFFTAVGSSISHALVSVWAAIIAAFASLGSGIDHIFRGFIHAISNFFSGIGYGISHFFQYILNIVQGFFSAIGHALSSLCSTIAQGFGDAGRGIDHAGQSMLEGLGRLINAFAFVLIVMMLFSLCIIVLCWLLFLVLHVIGLFRRLHIASVSAVIQQRMHRSPEHRPLLQSSPYRRQRPAARATPAPGDDMGRTIEAHFTRESIEAAAARYVQSLQVPHDEHEQHRTQRRYQQTHWNEAWSASNPINMVMYAFTTLQERAFGDQDMCIVCMEGFKNSKCDVARTVCNHMFHVDCIGSWFQHQIEIQNTPDCPICRQKFHFICHEEHSDAYGTF